MQLAGAADYALAEKFWPDIAATSQWAPHCYNTNLVA